MKRLLLIVFLVLLSACTLFKASPTVIVEDLFNKYQTLDEEVISQLDQVVLDDNLSDAQKEEYKTIIKKQYRNLGYTIKDEMLDGDAANVKVEIEVYDFNKTMNGAADYLASEPEEMFDENNELIVSNYADYKLDLMEKETERIKYTLNLTLSKSNGEWHLDDLTTEQKEKIHGIYDYD